jgi:DNA primase
LRPGLSIRAAVATLERIACEKRCRHLLDMLQAALEETSREYEQRPLLETYLAQIENAADEADALIVEESHCFEELEELKRLFYQEKRYLQQIDQQRCVSIQDLNQGVNDPFLPLN